MQRVLWLTDIHLNFVGTGDLERFLDSLTDATPAAVLIGGDISEAPDFGDYLNRIDYCLQVPIYFVLGNHDYYRGSILQVREHARQLCAEHPRLHYLTGSPPMALTPTVGLVGHDGWSDGRAGNYEHSDVMLNDYVLIRELSLYDKVGRRALLEALGDEAAAHIRQVLPAALDRWRHVILLTHVPPLREACWHEGHLSDDNWAPHFTCQAMGNAILEIMRDYPHHELTVLCGHTHSPGEAHPLNNVTILTGGAVYGRPAINRLFELE
jgi:3',5'-cyclic-AMP phosphodiesterase